VSLRYRDRLSDADQRLSDLQQTLQNLNSERDKLSESFESNRSAEQRRAASEHEQLSRHLQQLAAALSDRVAELEPSISTLERAQEEEKGNAELKLARLSQVFVSELQAARQAKEEELDRTHRPMMDLAVELAAIALDEERLNAAIDATINEERANLQEQALQELRETNQEIECIENEVGELVQHAENEGASELAKLEEEHCAAIENAKGATR
jgi:hypothetical protein